jgi:anti-sigma factor RsiW
MECQKAEYLVHGYLDGELELLGSHEFERHLGECATCAERVAKEQSLRLRFAGTALRFQSPHDLQGKAQAAMATGRPAVVPVVSQPRSRRRLWIVAAAIVAVSGLVAIAQTPSTESLLADQIRDGHIRSLMAEHLTDVESSDAHVVRPWFSGRLDFSPWTANLADAGFPLRGGRLDYFDNRRVAAIVFQRREHVINLFVWPTPLGETQSARFERQSNYQMLHWSAAGMTYWAVSDLDAAELSDFVALVQSHAQRMEPALPLAMQRATTSPPEKSDGR